MLNAKLILLYVLQSSDISSLGLDTIKVDKDEAYCMAINIYFESKSEDIKGQYAVAHATLNRVKDPRFPKSVCRVITQIGYLPSGTKVCAFSWFCEGNFDYDRANRKFGDIHSLDVDQFETAAKVAVMTLSGKAKDTTKGATHFHNPSLCTPDWIKGAIMTVRVGHHDFYREQPITYSYNKVEVTQIN